MYRTSHTKAWCDKCNRYQLTEQKRYLQATANNILNLPNILNINAAASKADIDFWKTKYEAFQSQKSTDSQSSSPLSWLPLRLYVGVESDNETLIIEDSKPANPNYVEYELTALISHVYDPSKKASKHSHLVTQIKVHPSYHEFQKKRTTSVTPMSDWYLFNDFHILPCSIDQVVDFSFKSPCVIYYTRIDINNRVPKLDLINPITADVFFWNATVNKKNVVNNRVIKIGETHQLPKEGDIIAVDAEFVSLASEETEIVSEANSNYYSRIVVNPTHYSLARVSVLLDQFPGSASPKEMSRFSPISGIPLVDDYIVTNEPIADYLTRYSGISPGDLDPNVSTHHLTTLKSVYLKLRYLVDTGCILIGHGLAKDFRILNILVPPHQVYDTVELFHLPGQRKISLKFLASCLLNLDIQGKHMIALKMHERHCLFIASTLNLCKKTSLTLFWSKFTKREDNSIGKYNKLVHLKQ